MRTPHFWQRKGLISTALLPVSGFYRLAHRSRVRGIVAKTLPVPVICVGNATAGGAGKTPVCLALLEWMHGRGVGAQCISRGYGGSLYGPVRVDPAIHTAAEVGDEPLLIARHAPCWVGKRRLSVATAAVLDGAACIVMDDGLQNPTVHKHLSILVIDGGYGFGNGRMLPAGPLREPVADAVAKADAAVLIGEDRTGALAQLPSGMPVLRAALEPLGERLDGQAVLAFAGIGRPQKFFETLTALGAHLVDAVPFADHHAYRPQELEHLARRAAALGARLMTTQKDAVRLTPEWQARVAICDIRLRFENEAQLAALCSPLLP